MTAPPPRSTLFPYPPLFRSFSRARPGLVSGPGHPRARGPPRYRLGVCLGSLCPPLPQYWCAPPPHPALHPAHERQSGALHPNPLARVGLPPRLFHVAPPHRGAARLAVLLQLGAPAWRAPRSSAHHLLGGPEQSRGSSKLDGGSSPSGGCPGGSARRDYPPATSDGRRPTPWP